MPDGFKAWKYSAEIIMKRYSSYTNAQHEAIKRYRAKKVNKMAQIIYLKRKQYILDDCMARHNMTAPELIRFLIENDYNGTVINVPEVKSGDIGKWLSPVFKAKEKVSEELCLKVLAGLSGNDFVAIGAMCEASGGISPVKLLGEILSSVSTEVTYASGELFLRCFEVSGGNRKALLDTIFSCGISVCDKFYPRKTGTLYARPRKKTA